MSGEHSKQSCYLKHMFGDKFWYAYISISLHQGLGKLGPLGGNSDARKFTFIFLISKGNILDELYDNSILYLEL